MSNLGLIGYNKRFLYCGVGAPGSTHDSRMLRSISLYEKIISGNIIPDKGITLGDFGNTLGYYWRCCVSETSVAAERLQRRYM